MPEMLIANTMGSSNSPTRWDDKGRQGIALIAPKEAGTGEKLILEPCPFSPGVTISLKVSKETG